MAQNSMPVLIILGLELSKPDTWDLCRRLRRRSGVPILMLTRYGDELDRITGLTLCADDYMIKPFSPRELTARVKAILRRTKSNVCADEVLEPLVHENLHLDLTRRRFMISDETVSLTPHEYALLRALMTAPGKVFTREELLEQIYPDGEATVIKRVVDVHVGKLRRKIEKDPSHPRFILTVRGTGYRFADPATVSS